MALNAQHKPFLRLKSLNDSVISPGHGNQARSHSAYRLMMQGVNQEALDSQDSKKPGIRGYPYTVAQLLPGAVCSPGMYGFGIMLGFEILVEVSSQRNI